MGREIFISYSRNDKDIVLPYIKILNKALRRECWIDLQGIESGVEFEEVIIKAISECKVVLFMLSDSSLASKWTKREVYYAEDEGKRIIPILVEGDQLRGWFKFHFGNVDFIDIRSEEQKDKLLRDLKTWLGIEEPFSSNQVEEEVISVVNSKSACPEICDVFISCSQKDYKFANKVCQAFNHAGISYYYNQEGTGDDWNSQISIYNIIKKSKIFLFLASKDSDDSNIINHEIFTAFTSKQMNDIIPYTINDSSLPDNLRFLFFGFNWRNVNEKNIETNLINEVLELLEKKSNSSDFPTYSYNCIQNHNSITHSSGYPKLIHQLIDNMVYVEGGTFQIGHSGPFSFFKKNKKNNQTVKVFPFYISKFPVTQAEWACLMDEKPSYFDGSELPVENVSWNDCQRFINRLNNFTGELFRLPTEVEWEFAARGGNLSKGYRYAGSNNIDDVAWYKENSENKTHKVGLKQPNELGLYDMSGNVYEWCEPQDPDLGQCGVLCGGAWCEKEEFCNVYDRFPSRSAADSLPGIQGIRLALTVINHMDPSF